MDADGNDVRTIYDGGDTIYTPRFPPGAYDPSCSPDGQWIVFEKPVSFDGENGDAGTWHIFKIHPDGTGLIDLSESGGHAARAEYLPSFSPDGQSIVFSARFGPADPGAVQIEVFTMDLDGGALQKLTQAPAYDDFATWIW
jgi:Tol biopolymer transport system component